MRLKMWNLMIGRAAIAELAELLGGPWAVRDARVDELTSVAIMKRIAVSVRKAYWTNCQNSRSSTNGDFRCLTFDTMRSWNSAVDGLAAESVAASVAAAVAGSTSLVFDSRVCSNSTSFVMPSHQT